MHDETILVETIAGIEEILAGDLDRISVERVAIGLFFTGVKLNTGAAGACATPLRSIPEAVCCPSSAMAMPFPGKLRGRPVRELLKEVERREWHPSRRGRCDHERPGRYVLGASRDARVELRIGIDAYDAAGIQPEKMWSSSAPLFRS